MNDEKIKRWTVIAADNQEAFDDLLNEAINAGWKASPESFNVFSSHEWPSEFYILVYTYKEETKKEVKSL